MTVPNEYMTAQTSARKHTKVLPNMPWRYVCMIALSPLLLLLLCPVLMHWSVYRNWAEDGWLTSQDARNAARNQPCDILIYGDSTATMGLDPRILSAQTGMRACSIASIAPVLQAVGTFTELDAYLTRNPPPRYLLLQFSAKTMIPNKEFQAKTNMEESYYYQMRMTPWDAVHTLLHQPDAISALLSFTYWHNAENALRKAFPSFPAPAMPFAVGTPEPDAGSYSILKAPSLTTCPASQLSPAHLLPVGAKQLTWIRDTEQTYRSKAQRVLITVAPSSPCNLRFPQWKSALATADIPAPEQWPMALFADGFHLNRQGAIHLSQEYAARILAAEQTHPTEPLQQAKSN